MSAKRGDEEARELLNLRREDEIDFHVTGTKNTQGAVGKAQEHTGDTGLMGGREQTDYQRVREQQRLKYKLD